MASIRFAVGLLEDLSLFFFQVGRVSVLLSGKKRVGVKLNCTAPVCGVRVGQFWEDIQGKIATV